MGKGTRKLTGFLWALILAIVSFFVIYFFFPDVSDRFFGAKGRKSDVEKAVEQTVDDVKDKVSDIGREVVSDVVSGVVK